MAPADAQPAAAVQLIALHKLSLSEENVRKTDPGLQASAELKANIAALGVLSNLVVRAVDDTSDLYAVLAGGRRYKALVALAEEGQIPSDMPVPCRVVPADASATEISLSENAVRAAMHPADQVEAFAALAGDGATVSAIAARFGVAERTVEQRLRLGNAAPELLQAYRDEAIDLECLKAFAVTTDPVRQLAAWKQVSEQGYRPTAWQIRRLLTDSRVPGAAAVARFVGAEAYEAAGGALDRDLFADEHEVGVWLEDAQLLDRLAIERLQKIADKAATEWNWAEPRLEADWNELAPYGRVHPVPAEPTPEEAAERDRLYMREDELVNLDDEDWTAELEAEGERIRDRLRELQAAVDSRASFTDADKAIAGCIVTIDPEGEVETIEGLVRPEDVPAPANGTSAHAATPGRAANGSGTGASAAPSSMTMPSRPADPAAEARRKAGIGIGLADDMRAIRTAIVKARLAGDFGAAFDLFVFQAARSVFTAGYRATALEIAVRETADRPHVRTNDDSFGDHSPAEALLADRSRLRLDWLTAEDDSEAFALFRALPLDAKQDLFAACIARTVKGQLAFEPAARPEFEATVARLDIDFAAEVRPTEDLFWSRIKKSQMLDIAGATLGRDWAASHGKDKKAVLAHAMHRAFVAADDVPAGVTPEGRAAALAWTMPGFAAFDTGAEDTDESCITDPHPTPLVKPGAERQPDVEDNASEEPANAASSQPDTQAGSFVVDVPAADPAEEAAPSVSHAIDAMNAVPTADGGPPVIVHHVDASNGHAASGEALDIPEFLRRS